MGKDFKILMYEKMHSRGTELLEKSCQLIYPESLKEGYLLERVGDIDAIVIRSNGAITRKIIEAAPKLKVIGRHGVGLDSIDLETARKRGVRVVYTPTANSEAVSEHFVALALLLAKKVRAADIALREGNWNARYELIGTELFGKTLGIMGFGRIGKQTARICRNGFKMNILFYDLLEYPEVSEELNALRVEKEKLFEESDFISINLPLVPETRHFINSHLLNLMKPSAFLINMARGPIWKESDIYSALETNIIAGAGSDVYEQEPVEKDNPLFRLDNFVGTPHMSAHTEEGMIRMSMVASDVMAVLQNREPEFPVI